MIPLNVVPRTSMSSLTLALLIFGVCYALIMTERLHKTIVALFGAVS